MTRRVLWAGLLALLSGGGLGMGTPLDPATRAVDFKLEPYRALTYWRPFQAGKTLPLKLQTLCGGTNLDPAKIVPPQIIGLSKDGVALDITTLNLNADPPNPNSPFFRYPSSGSVWNYNLSSKYLSRGTYVITIRLGGDQDYLGGFILN